MERRDIDLIVDRKINLGVIKGSHYGYDFDLKVEVETQLRKEEGKGLVLSICASVHNMGASQCIESLREAVDQGHLVPNASISMEDVKRMLEIWKKWHLNDLRPSPDGKAWCFEELPADVVEFIKKFGEHAVKDQAA